MVQTNQTRSESFRILRGTPSVLCVDDEPLTRKALHRLLRKGPCTLHFAETPRIAHFRKVLAPLDGSIEAELSLGSVLPLLEGTPMRLILLRVTNLGLHPDVYNYLRRSRERLSSQGIDVIADIRRGDPAEQILL